MIRPETLVNPERDLGLDTRVPVVTPPEIEPDPEEETGELPPGRPLAERIAAARRLMARPEDGCRDCWTHGRDAAVAVIQAEGRAGIEDAHRLAPKGSELHWLASWQRGRDAALGVIEGE